MYAERTVHEEPDQSDRTLLVQYLRGSREAAEVVLVRHERILRAYLSRRLTDPELVEEALQETFLRLLENAASLVRHPRLEGWLFLVARNVSADILRLRRRSSALSTPMGDCGLEDGIRDRRSHTPDVELRRRELSRLVLRAVDCMPDAERQVFLLRTQFQLPFREIAQRQDAPINTVLSRMHRALRRIRRVLEAAGWSGEDSSDGAGGGESS